MPRTPRGPAPRLTPQDVKEIRETEGQTVRELAARYGVHYSTISRVRAGVLHPERP